MKATDIVQPMPMATAIAANGSKDNIPQEQSSATDTWYCSVEKGFPDITMKPMDEGGYPPRGQGANGLFYIASDQKVYLQNGGSITFDQDVSDEIGGYPQGAVLDYIESGNFNKVISLIDDNTYNFVNDPSLIDGTHWQKLLFSGDDFLNKNQISNCVLEAPNGVYSKSGRTITIKQGLKVLIPNGLNSDKTLNNIELTVSNDIAQTLSYGTGQVRTCFLTSSETTIYVNRVNILGYYKYTSNFPATVDSASITYYAFSRGNNSWYTTSGATTANWTATNVIPLLTAYFSSDSDISIESTNYAVKLVDTDMADGNWVYKVSSLNSSTAYNTYDIDLSSVLPRNNYFYECLFTFEISRTDASTANSYYTATIDGVAVGRGFVDGGSTATDNKMDYGQFVGIINNSRSMQIQLSGTSGVNLNGHNTRIVAYRRLGTNA